jgi:hypothetical protein
VHRAASLQCWQFAPRLGGLGGDFDASNCKPSMLVVCTSPGRSTGVARQSPV